MPDGWMQTSLDGVLRRRLVSHEDTRGSFSELWRASWTALLSQWPFVQANLSRSHTAVLRGMHFHERQADLWIVLEGRAYVALTDLREMVAGRADRPASTGAELGVADALYIPRCVAHGFLAMEPLTLLYLVTGEYDGTDEHGFAWDDPLASIAWPAPAPVLSERDRANPGLVEAVASARQRAGQSASR